MNTQPAGQAGRSHRLHERLAAVVASTDRAAQDHPKKMWFRHAKAAQDVLLRDRPMTPEALRAIHAFAARCFDGLDRRSQVQALFARGRDQQVRLMRWARPTEIAGLVCDAYDVQRTTHAQVHLCESPGNAKRAAAVAEGAIEWSYFFQIESPGTRFAGMDVYYYGIQNMESGCVMGLEYRMPVSRLLLYLVAARGYAAASDTELAIGGWYAGDSQRRQFHGDGVALFAAMVEHPAVTREVRVVACGARRSAAALLERIAQQPCAVRCDFGASVKAPSRYEGWDEVVWASAQVYGISSAGDVLALERQHDEIGHILRVIRAATRLPGRSHTDGCNESGFFFLLLTVPARQAALVFAAMARDNPAMLARAGRLYRSMPGYAQPRLARWEAKWPVSGCATAWLQRTLRVMQR